VFLGWNRTDEREFKMTYLSGGDACLDRTMEALPSIRPWQRLPGAVPERRNADRNLKFGLSMESQSWRRSCRSAIRWRRPGLAARQSRRAGGLAEGRAELRRQDGAGAVARTSGSTDDVSFLQIQLRFLRLGHQRSGAVRIGIGRPARTRSVRCVRRSVRGQPARGRAAGKHASVWCSVRVAGGDGRGHARTAP